MRRDNLDRLRSTQVDILVVGGGVTGVSIARDAAPERTEEAFLVGLLQECGVLLLVQVFGSTYASVCRSSLSPSAFYAVERETFPHTHVDAIADQNQETNQDSYIHADGHLYAHPHSYPYTDFHPNATAHTRRGLSRSPGAHLDVPLHL